MADLVPVADVAAWCNLPVTSAPLKVAHDAAEAMVAERCTWPATDADGNPVDAPGSLKQAVYLMTARLLDRRQTPTGLVQTGELGPAYIASTDRDVDRLLMPWRTQVLG